MKDVKHGRSISPLAMLIYLWDIQQPNETLPPRLQALSQHWCNVLWQLNMLWPSCVWIRHTLNSAQQASTMGQTPRLHWGFQHWDSPCPTENACTRESHATILDQRLLKISCIVGCNHFVDWWEICRGLTWTSDWWVTVLKYKGDMWESADYAFEFPLWDLCVLVFLEEDCEFIEIFNVFLFGQWDGFLGKCK